VADVESRPFSEVLWEAVTGGHEAIEALLLRFMPLINRESFSDCGLDEDLRQYIMLRTVIQIQSPSCKKILFPD
jgi:hypothetical protein